MRAIELSKTLKQCYLKIVGTFAFDERAIDKGLSFHSRQCPTNGIAMWWWARAQVGLTDISMCCTEFSNFMNIS